MFKTSFLTLTIFLLTIPIAAQERQLSQSKTNLKWYDLRELGIEGKGWSDTKNIYDRLPAKAETIVRAPVWTLAGHSAGMSARFVTDSDSIYVRWALKSPNLALPHMAATGVSGVDLYVRENEKWHWLGVGKPEKSATNEQKLIGNLIPTEREYLLYLPLYNGVESVEIGVSENAKILKAAPYPTNKTPPIVFYGTSIVQGAVASRPGMAYPAILGRRLNRSTINLGFSGNGKMESEMAELLTEIDAAVYVIDCLPNLTTGAEVEERTIRLVETIRRKRPQTPIILQYLCQKDV